MKFTKQVCSLLIIFNILLEVAINENAEHGKEKTIFTNYMVVYLESPRQSRN